MLQRAVPAPACLFQLQRARHAVPLQNPAASAIPSAATLVKKSQFGAAGSHAAPLRFWRGADLAPIARSRHSPSTFRGPCKFLLDTQLHKKYSWKIE
jgi:hypothetical protein